MEPESRRLTMETPDVIYVHSGVSKIYFALEPIGIGNAME
jgi:hypothetical protein